MLHDINPPPHNHGSRPPTPAGSEGAMTLSAQDVAQLRAALQDAVVKCSERCLYQSSKW